MMTIKNLVQNDKVQTLLDEGGGEDTREEPCEPYSPPDKPLHQYTDGELTEAVSACKDCGGYGLVRIATASIHEWGFGKLVRCQSCTRYQEEQDRRRILLHVAPIIQRYSMLKGDLVSKTFDTYNRDIDQKTEASFIWDAVRGWAADVYYDRPHKAPWLYMHGTAGNGKTHLAAAAALGLQKVNVAVVFSTLPELLGMVSRSGFTDKEDLIYALQRINVLIIDDIRAEDLKVDWVISVLFRILDRRYIERAPTLLVSNLPVTGDVKPTIADFVPRIASRLGDRSVCRIVMNRTRDYRGVK